jgi:hypothetical protein
MYDLAHACPTCRTVTIFSPSAPYPRRCGQCDAVVRAAPTDLFVARPVWDENDRDAGFALELGPAQIEAAPY